MKVDATRLPQQRGQGGEWMLIAGAVFLALLLGGAIGLQPVLVAPVAVLALLLAALGLGLRSARRTFASAGRWQAFALLMFWALVINVPTFLAFDQSGFSREHGLFNAQSLSRVFVFLFGALLAIVFWVTSGAVPAGTRQRVRGIWLLIAVYVWYCAIAPLVSGGTAAALAIFRASEWLVAFFLLGLLFQAQNRAGQTSFRDRLRLVLPMYWFIAGSVLLLLAVRPSAAFQVSSLTGIGRLGSMFAHPNLVAIVVTVLFAYALVFLRSWRRLFVSAVMLTMLVLTYSRGGYVAFTGVLVLGGVLFWRTFVDRLILVCAISAMVLVAAHVPGFIDEVTRILSRGNEREGLSTLSERTAIWEAAKIMIVRSPIMGEGFISGPKELGEVMQRYRLSHNIAAVHAHNEWLQAQISGGIFALMLSLGIHVRVLYLLVRCRHHAGRRVTFVMGAMFVSIVTWGLLGPSLTYFLSLPGVIVGWLLLTLEHMYRDAGATDSRL